MPINRLYHTKELDLLAYVRMFLPERINSLPIGL
jgi:hypothetical protein